MTQMESKDCSLRLAAEGTAEPCPEERCPFWEQAGVAFDGRCFIETLGRDATQPDVAGYLLELRTKIEATRHLAEREVAHREFSRRIGLEL